MKKALVLFAAVVGVCAGSLLADEALVRAVGVNATYRGAVNEALISALEQRLGTTVSTTERAQIANAASSTSVAQNGQVDDQRKLEITDAINREVRTASAGRISGYRVLGDTYDPLAKRYRVEIEARFPAAYASPGLDPANRRRMAVMTFRPTRASFSWYNQTGKALDWASALADKLNVRLTQTRKFTMLDRKFDAEVDAELARLRGANAAAEDIGRLGRKLGTDYLVVGEIALNDVTPPPVNPYTGRAMPQGPALFAEVTYRVLLAPTGQLKWTDTVRLDARAFASSSLAGFISATAETAAETITQGLMDNILPFEIVGRTASGQLIVGEGGKSLNVGEFFTVFALGEEVKDTRTGEVLDQVEDAVGTVQIVRVSAKMSYAQVVEGDAAKMTVGSRLRRVPPTAGAVSGASVPAPATPVKVTPAGGVVVPF